MSETGMNVEAVHAVAQQLHVRSRDIASLEASINGIIEQINSNWRGACAARFSADWQSHYRPNLRLLSERIDGLGRSAQNNAHEQERASRGRGCGVSGTTHLAGAAVQTTWTVVAGGVDAQEAAKWLHDVFPGDLADDAPEHVALFGLVSGEITMIGGRLTIEKGWRTKHFGDESGGAVQLATGLANVLAAAKLASKLGGPAAVVSLADAMLPNTSSEQNKVFDRRNNVFAVESYGRQFDDLSAAEMDRVRARTADYFGADGGNPALVVGRSIWDNVNTQLGDNGTALDAPRNDPDMTWMLQINDRQ